MEWVVTFGLKPLLYWVAYSAAAAAWEEFDPPRPSRNVVAALARFALGLVLGLPVGFLLVAHHATTQTAMAVLFPLRVALWFGTTLLFYREVPVVQAARFSTLAAVLSQLLELAAAHGTWVGNLRDLRIC